MTLENRLTEVNLQGSWISHGSPCLNHWFPLYCLMISLHFPWHVHGLLFSQSDFQDDLWQLTETGGTFFSNLDPWQKKAAIIIRIYGAHSHIVATTPSPRNSRILTTIVAWHWVGGYPYIPMTCQPVDFLSKPGRICWGTFPFVAARGEGEGSATKGSTKALENYTPVTWQWNFPIFSRGYIFKRSIIHCHVSLAEGNMSTEK